MDNEIMVSIMCATYNHEKYIADAIESFLMQKTNFSYEILIHDDASTDKTAEIIKDYELKYPKIIKPIYQTENQYSKGVKFRQFNRERAQGKYIALCEGDDYWIDPYKLQKQVNYMERHSECSLCVHASYKVRTDKSKVKPHFHPNQGNKLFTVEEVILGGGGLFATNSMLYQAKFKNNRPDFFNDAPIGDYPLTIYLAVQGEVYYIDEFMSAYRSGVPDSWTSRLSSSSVESRIEFNNKLIKMLNEINTYTKYEYNDVINKKNKQHRFNSLLLQERFSEIKAGEYEELYNVLNTSDKFKIFIKKYFPSIAKVLIKAKRKLIR